MTLVLSSKRVQFPFLELPSEIAEIILDLAAGPLFKSPKNPRYQVLRKTCLLSKSFRMISQYLLGKFVYLRDNNAVRLWLLDSPKWVNSRWLEPPTILEFKLLEKLLKRAGPSGPRLMKLALDAAGDDDLFSDSGLSGLKSLELAMNLRAARSGPLEIPFELTHLSLASTYPLHNHLSSRFISTVLFKAQDSLLDLKFSTANWKVEDDFVKSIGVVASSLQRIQIKIGTSEINEVFLPFFKECEQVEHLTITSATLPTNLPQFLRTLRVGNKAKSLYVVLDLSRDGISKLHEKGALDGLVVDGLRWIGLTGIKAIDIKMKSVVKELGLKGVMVNCVEL